MHAFGYARLRVSPIPPCLPGFLQTATTGLWCTSDPPRGGQIAMSQVQGEYLIRHVVDQLTPWVDGYRSSTNRVYSLRAVRVGYSDQARAAYVQNEYRLPTRHVPPQGTYTRSIVPYPSQLRRPPDMLARQPATPSRKCYSRVGPAGRNPKVTGRRLVRPGSRPAAVNGGELALDGAIGNVDVALEARPVLVPRYFHNRLGPQARFQGQGDERAPGRVAAQ